MNDGICTVGLLGLLCLAGSALAQIGETRVWTSDDGRQITAKLVSVSETSVVISRGGRPTEIAITKFSAADQEFIAAIAKQQAEGAVSKEADAARAIGFKEGKYADAVKGEWVKFDKAEHGLIYQLYIGREATRKKAGPLVPLFVQLHGASGRRDDIEAGKVEIAAKKLVEPSQYSKTPCVVCVPLCPPEPESWGKQTSKLEAIIDDLVANLPIDRQRIYISGYSMGAGGVASMLSSRPDFYGGALFADGSPRSDWHGKVKTPMWFYFSGERDSSKMEEAKTRFSGDGVELKFDVFKDVEHNGIHWKMANEPEVFEWLFQQGIAAE